MGARERERTERLQVVWSTEELAAVDEFKFENRGATSFQGDEQHRTLVDLF